MNQSELTKFVQVLIATWGLAGLVLLFAPGRMIEVFTHGRVLFSRRTILLFRIVGGLSVLGACSRLFLLHW